MNLKSNLHTRTIAQTAKYVHDPAGTANEYYLTLNVLVILFIVCTFSYFHFTMTDGPVLGMPLPAMHWGHGWIADFINLYHKHVCVTVHTIKSVSASPFTIQGGFVAMLDCIKTIAVDKAPQTLAMMFKYGFACFLYLHSS
jgi:hypothetical protein